MDSFKACRMEVLVKVCLVMGCDIGDIMEVYPETRG